MPIFEYECESCHKRFEDLVRNPVEETGTLCPQCGSRDVKKQFSSFGVAIGNAAPMACDARQKPPGPCRPHGCECF